MPEFRRIYVQNPFKRVKKAKVSRRSRPKRRSRKNPGPIGGVLTIMINPKRKKRNGRKRRNPFKLFAAKKAAKKTSRRHRRSNPFLKAHRRRSSRRRNPFQVTGNNTTQILKLALGAGAGAVATRAATQLVLKDKNQGIMGYGGNVVAAMLFGYLGGRFISPEVGSGMLAGGLAATVQRVWDEKASKVLPAAAGVITGQPSTKGMGDVSYSDDGMGALGDYVNASFTDSRILGPYSAPAAAPAPTSAPTLKAAF